MPNYQVFTDSPMSVLVTNNATNPVVVNDPAASIAIQQGNLFIATTDPQDMSSNIYMGVQVTNPANSGKTIYVNSIIGGAIKDTIIGIYRNATFSGTGTAPTPRNTNYGFSDTSSMTVKFLLSSTDPRNNGVLLYYTMQVGGPIEINYNGRIIVPSSSADQTIYLRIVNTGGIGNNVSIGIEWWELPS
jgi:hypothetical protein